jgi:hypothetical protein
MHMKEKICLTGLLLGTNHGCITTNPNPSVLQSNGNIPVLLEPKSSRLHHHLGKLCLPCLGFSGSTVRPFSEEWWKYEFCIVLWISVKASGCNSQKTAMPAGKRGTASSWQCQIPREYENYTGNFLNIRLTALTRPLVTSISLVR